MRRFLTVMALMALLTTMLGGAPALADHCPGYPPGNFDCHPATPPGPPPGTPPPGTPPPSPPPDHASPKARASTPAATGNMELTGGSWAGCTPITITYANGNTISGAVDPNGECGSTASASSASASSASAGSGSHGRGASSLRIFASPDGTFSASIQVPAGDSPQDSVVVISGSDAAGNSHIVAVTPGNQASSLGAVTGDPEAALDAAIAHSGVLASAGGPFTVGGAATVALFLAGAVLLLVTRRRSKSEI